MLAAVVFVTQPTVLAGPAADFALRARDDARGAGFLCVTLVSSSSSSERLGWRIAMLLLAVSKGIWKIYS